MHYGFRVAVSGARCENRGAADARLSKPSQQLTKTETNVVRMGALQWFLAQNGSVCVLHGSSG